MPRDAVSRTANVERNGGHKWVKILFEVAELSLLTIAKTEQNFRNNTLRTFQIFHDFYLYYIWHYINTSNLTHIVKKY